MQMVNIPNEISWADNMLTALKHVKTKYVLVVFDDHWLNQKVNEQRLHELYTAMQTEDAAMLQLRSYNLTKFQHGKTNLSSANDVVYRDKFAQYKTCLEAGIWNTAALTTLLRPGEDPWTFELAGSIRSHGYPKEFLFITANEPFQYINAAHQGHITPEALNYVAQNNIPFDQGKFPALRKFNWKITYKSWKLRLRKLVNFVQNPGLFYEFRTT